VKAGLSSRCNELVRERIEENVQKVAYRRWRADLQLNGPLQWCSKHNYDPGTEQEQPHVKIALSTASNSTVSLPLSRGAQVEKHKQAKQSFFYNLMILGQHQNGALDNFPTLRKYWETHARHQTGIPHPEV